MGVFAPVLFFKSTDKRELTEMTVRRFERRWGEASDSLSVWKSGLEHPAHAVGSLLSVSRECQLDGHARSLLDVRGERRRTQHPCVVYSWDLRGLGALLFVHTSPPRLDLAPMELSYLAFWAHPSTTHTAPLSPSSRMSWLSHRAAQCVLPGEAWQIWLLCCLAWKGRFYLILKDLHKLARKTCVKKTSQILSV